jgi:hypothetical protein
LARSASETGTGMSSSFQSTAVILSMGVRRRSPQRRTVSPGTDVPVKLETAQRIESMIRARSSALVSGFTIAKRVQTRPECRVGVTKAT